MIASFTFEFLISNVVVDSIFSTKYGLGLEEDEAVVCNPLRQVASLYDEGLEHPIFPSSPTLK